MSGGGGVGGSMLVVRVLLVLEFFGVGSFASFDSCFGCPTLKDRCHICTFMLKLMPV